MPRREWSDQALAGLDHLVLSHRLPADTRARIEASTAPLARFPRFGPVLEERADGVELRFLIGPWPWLVIVYAYLAGEDRSAIVSVEDGRSASSTAERGRRPPRTTRD